MKLHKKIILVRHGEVHNPNQVFYGQTLQVELSDLGRQQIDSVGKQIKELKYQLRGIHSSTLLRAIQTSEVLAKYLKTDIIPHRELVDIHIPALIGKPTVLRKELHAKGEDEYSGEWLALGHESRSDIIKRMRKAFDAIFAKADDKVPVIVSHGDPLTFLIYNLHHPEKSLPDVGSIIKAGYGLNKGHGIILTLNEKQQILDKKPILPVVGGEY